MKSRIRLMVLTGIIAAAVLTSPASAAHSKAPFVVSRQSASDGGMEVDRSARTSDVSGNGRYVVFESKADNLTPMADDVRNIYRYDTRLEKVELVSRNGRRAADGKSQDAAISGSGRYVAFRSNARNLGPTNPNSYLNIYVYDAKRNRTELVSRQSKADGGLPANGWSEVPDISANGRVVSFTTTASNLGGPIDARKNVYAYDRKKRRAELVSRQSSKDGGLGGNHGSLSASRLSDSGRFVAFTSKATNLGGPAKGLFNGFVYDRRRQRTLPVAPDVGTRDSYAHVDAISGDGRRVAYYVNSGRDGSGVFLENVGGGNRDRLGRGLGDAELSRSGRFATAVDSFRRRIQSRRIAAERVVRVDTRNGDRRVVSHPIVRPDGDERASDAWDPAISGDGRAISFTSGLSFVYEAHGVPDLVFLRRYR